jgi:hypothetical protein
MFMQAERGLEHRITVGQTDRRYTQNHSYTYVLWSWGQRTNRDCPTSQAALQALQALQQGCCVYFCSTTLLTTFASTHVLAARVMPNLWCRYPSSPLFFAGVRRLLQPLPVSLQPSPVLWVAALSFFSLTSH